MRGYRKGRRVRVHTQDGQTLDGVLIAHYPEVLVLGHVALLSEADPQGEGTALGGEVKVERTNVSFVQEF